MLEDIIESFRTGNIRKHIDAQRNWVKNQNHVVEFNIGWLAKQIDPLGRRAHFEVIYV
jgi:hypothetical protein